MNHTGTSPRRNFRHPSSDLGWTDYMLGESYPKEYDTWDLVAQRNYENGRLRAAQYSTLTGKFPTRQVKQPIYQSVLPNNYSLSPAIPRSFGRA